MKTAKSNNRAHSIINANTLTTPRIAANGKREWVVNYISAIPDREIYVGMYVKTIGRRCLHVVDTHEPVKLYKLDINEFYDSLHDDHSEIQWIKDRL